MPKGNSKAYLNSPLHDDSDIDITENANMISCILESFNAPLPDLNKPDEVEKAINDYFKRCISRGLRPGNLGLYNSIGLDKNNVRDLVQGRVKTVNGKSVNVGTISLIKKAIKQMGEFREMLGSQGKLNPATLIFWQKNFDGLEDVQRVDVAPINALQPERTPEELQKLIEEDIPQE
jgi:hypothetical protein